MDVYRRSEGCSGILIENIVKRRIVQLLLKKTTATVFEFYTDIRVDLQATPKSKST